MDHDNGISNGSGNRPFHDVLATRLSRRQVLAGGVATAAATFLGGTGNALAHGWKKGWHEPLIGFTPVALADGSGPVPHISPDYEYDILIPWGEPLEPGGPEFGYPPSAAAQALQIGIGHDGMWFFPIEDRQYRDEDFDDSGRYRGHHHAGNAHGMLAVNLEFGGNQHVLGKPFPTSLDDVRVMQHAHGVAVVEIEKRGKWRTVKSAHARRIHVNTPVDFSGPAAGHPLLQTLNGNVPLGTVNNCANGYTPWGTYLTCEENFNGYFGASNLNHTWVRTPAQARYGFGANGFGYGWHLFDKRFDLSDPEYANEENRFGWVVEIDPMDGTQVPVKRTALGRIKHEGAAVTVGRGGRVVVYMGDDERFDYLYKFVSDDNWKSMRRQGLSPLDHGKLYVARFNDDGSGVWLELTIADPALAAQFADQGEILIHTRIAADILGATPMDRPEWSAVAPNGDVYMTMTNNTARTSPNGPNPLAPNPHGHIIRWHDSDDHVGLDFIWDIFLLAQDTHGTEDAFGSPDGLWADPDGRLFIQTDGAQPNGLNDQMLVADTGTGELRRLFSGVTGCEITGVAVTPDRRTLFVNVQHPGDGDPGLTNFPLAYDGVTIPRDATVVITRKDGGVIGS